MSLSTFLVATIIEFMGILCNRCHLACCKKQKMQPILMPGEVKTFETFMAPLARTKSLFRIRTKENGDCLFLTFDGRCAMYQIRPFLCRYFPWLPVFGLNSNWWGLSDDCPHRDRFETPDARIIPAVDPNWVLEYQKYLSGE